MFILETLRTEYARPEYITSLRLSAIQRNSDIVQSDNLRDLLALCTNLKTLTLDVVTDEGSTPPSQLGYGDNNVVCRL